MVHVGNKGKNGEREVVHLLIAALEDLMQSAWLPNDEMERLRKVVQRNQNQSAEGGGDILLFGLAIEVKRQETLSIDTWWKQTCKSAERNKDMPILIYRQNRKSWYVVMDGYLEIPHQLVATRVTIELPDFVRWFKRWAEHKIRNGEIDRV